MSGRPIHSTSSGGGKAASAVTATTTVPTPGQLKKEIFDDYCDSLQRELNVIQQQRETAERVGRAPH